MPGDLPFEDWEHIFQIPSHLEVLSACGGNPPRVVSVAISVMFLPLEGA